MNFDSTNICSSQHNGDNYTNKRYSMIYLDDNNKENIKKNKMKLMKKK